MAIYRIKRYSLLDRFKAASSGFLEGAAVGGLLGGGFTASIGELKPVLIATGICAAIGGLMNAYSGWVTQSALDKYQTKANNININEPNTVEQLYKKYPKLRELDIFRKNQKILSDIAEAMDDYRIILDWEDMDFELICNDDYDNPHYHTKYIRQQLKSNSWLAGVGCLCYNIDNNEFFLVDTYSKSIKKMSVKEYEKYLINCIEIGIQNSENEKSIKVGQKSIQTLKRIFKL